MRKGVSDTNAEVLAEALAERLAAVVPPGVSVTPEDGEVRVASAATSMSAVIRRIVNQEGEHASNIELAVLSVLNAVQDFVSEELREPWPSAAPAAMALPGVH